MSDVCRSCHQSITWAVTQKGKRMPLDPEPTAAGNIVLTHADPPVAIPQSKISVEQLRAQCERDPQGGPLRLYTSHWTTCDADKQ
jgi:hypothetical protein